MTDPNPKALVEEMCDAYHKPSQDHAGSDPALDRAHEAGMRAAARVMLKRLIRLIEEQCDPGDSLIWYSLTKEDLERFAHEHNLMEGENDS